MSMRMGKGNYEALVAEDIAWLERQPRTLERDHIRQILRRSVELEYPTPKASVATTPNGSHREPERHPPTAEERRLMLAQFDVANPDLVGQRCHAHRDGDCFWDRCPQNRDGEPYKTGRHCPLDRREDDDD